MTAPGFVFKIYKIHSVQGTMHTVYFRELVAVGSSVMVRASS